jgi:hypothetical protein
METSPAARAIPLRWRDHIKRVPRATLTGLGLINVIGTEYRNDGDAMLRSILGALQDA